MKKTVVELFAGVGGFRCGLNKVELIKDKVKENGDWKFVWANQWEPATKTQEAFECYIKRFGDKDASNVDIFQVDKKKIPNHTLLVVAFHVKIILLLKHYQIVRGLRVKKVFYGGLSMIY